MIAGLDFRLACGALLRPGLGLILLGLVPLHAGPAAAQQSAPGSPAAPLPSVVYPLDVPDTGAPSIGPLAGLTQPQVIEGNRQYVLAGGVWGFWDRERHFHRVPEAVVSGSLQRPAAGVTGEPGANFRGAVSPRPPARFQMAPRAVVHLPSAAPGRIVTEQVSAGGRGRVR